jgi:two-component system, chemotaxis family, protein-glutamate methylesterase/glutaminase
MQGHDIVVVGASAGGVETLASLVRPLPPDFPAALFIVLHIPPDSTSHLPRILMHKGSLPAAHAVDGEPIVPGRIYIAPPDRHLIVEPGYVRVSHGPRENRARPAVDPLFRSAARAYGSRVISVILSGALDDGTAGAMAVRQQGGISVVQQPEDALFPGMPTSAITNDSPDHILPIAEIPPLLMRLVHDPAAKNGGHRVSESIDKEIKLAEIDLDTIEDPNKMGKPSVFACPECGGVLWEMHDGKLLRYRCRVGHAYTADSLLADQTDHLEAALWAALRGLEEKAALAQRLHDRAHERGHHAAALRFAEQAAAAHQHAAIVRGLLANGQQSAASAVKEDTACERRGITDAV